MSSKKVWIVCVFILCCPAAPGAQIKRPPETRNAALRYWLAFADLQDPTADKATAELLEKTAAGEAAWDEAKLGPILDKNQDAIQRMQRATNLPECDWGLEYELGPRASIAYAPRARVLARLNTLYGMRLAARGDSQGALDTWLAGIRFSQHLAQGGTLIFSLIAKMGLLSNFHALAQAEQNRSLSAEQQRQVETAVRALPDSGFDWGTALEYEADPLDLAVSELKSASNPAASYRALTGNPAPENFTVPTPAEVAAFHRVMIGAGQALRLPPQQAQERLKLLQDSMKTLNPFYREMTPSFVKINESRVQIEAARATLLQALGR